MRGKGDLQLVFAYMIANATEDGICDFTPQCIADATGKPLALIIACIQELEGPDGMSRTRADDGRRIRLLDPERPWGWSIINHGLYRAIAGRESMKEAERLRKRAYRAAVKPDVPDMSRTTPDNSANGGGVGVASASGSEGECKGGVKTGLKFESAFRTLAACPKLDSLNYEAVATLGRDYPVFDLNALAGELVAEAETVEGARIGHPVAWLTKAIARRLRAKLPQATGRKPWWEPAPEPRKPMDAASVKARYDADRQRRRQNVWEANGNPGRVPDDILQDVK